MFRPHSAVATKNCDLRTTVLRADLFAARCGAPPPEGDLRGHLLSFWSGDEHDDLRTGDGLEPLAIVSPEAVDLRLNGIHNTREFIGVLLGGASRSNLAAAAAFSSWAMRRPVVAHVVQREGQAVALPSRALKSRWQDQRSRDPSKPLTTTMSASPSPTAARIDRPSADHDTRRAMNVARSPKSVT